MKIAQIQKNVCFSLARHSFEPASTLSTASHRCLTSASMKAVLFPVPGICHLRKRRTACAFQQWFCHPSYHWRCHTGFGALLIDTSRWRLCWIEQFVVFHSSTRRRITRSLSFSPLRCRWNRHLDSSPVLRSILSSNKICRKKIRRRASSTAHDWFSGYRPFSANMSFATMIIGYSSSLCLILPSGSSASIRTGNDVDQHLHHSKTLQWHWPNVQTRHHLHWMRDNSHRQSRENPRDLKENNQHLHW